MSNRDRVHDAELVSKHIYNADIWGSKLDYQAARLSVPGLFDDDNEKETEDETDRRL